MREFGAQERWDLTCVFIPLPAVLRRGCRKARAEDSPVGAVVQERDGISSNVRDNNRVVGRDISGASPPPPILT